MGVYEGHRPEAAYSGMAKAPNYSFEKRQRELEKKRKNAEKAARKAAPAPAPADVNTTSAPAEPGKE